VNIVHGQTVNVAETNIFCTSSPQCWNSTSLGPTTVCIWCVVKIASHVFDIVAVSFWT